MSPDDLANWFEERRSHFHDLARHIVGTRADADDVVQDAFVRALDGLGDAIRSPGAWMTTTVRHLAFDHLRHRSVVRQFAALDEAGGPGDGRHDVPVEDALGQRLEAAAALRTIVDVLDAVDTAAMLLRIVFDEDYALLARRFGKSEGAMRVALHRARQRVRDATVDAAREGADDEGRARTFAVCWHAIETRDASVLHAMIDGDVTMALRQDAAADPAAPPVRVSTVHHGGRYVLALRQGDHLICVLPIGVVAHDTACAVD